MTEQQPTNSGSVQGPNAMTTSVEFSMAWLSTQGDIGKLAQRTLITALQDNEQLHQLLQGQTQELAKSRETLDAQREEIDGFQALANDRNWLAAQLSSIGEEPIPEPQPRISKK